MIFRRKKKHLLIKMSLDTQKLDSTQRQQIMASVQQQLALQNAQELLQVRWNTKYFNSLFFYFII